MANFSMVVTHNLSQDEALRRLQNEIDNLKRQYPDSRGKFQDGWKANVYALEGRVMGFSGSGTMTVHPSQVEITADLPWQATLFKRRIESVIRERLREVLA
jgi:Putative polyhydroxyalkanoic acid system protein (PHA_gran_rgn)